MSAARRSCVGDLAQLVTVWKVMSRHSPVVVTGTRIYVQGGILCAR